MKDQAPSDAEPGGGAAANSCDVDAEGEGDGVEPWLLEAVSAPHARSLPRRGQIIGGKYRIEELLGRGGMGAVFRARHLVTEKPVAIKWMLESGPGLDVQARRRFQREALAGGRIDHPNVVDLYDVGEEGGCSFLVMELLRGESLRTRLGRGPLDPVAALGLLLPAMRGVAAAHRAGVIHRDLKPDNLFVCRESDGRVAIKVLDFGISSVASSLASDATLTQEGTLLGSLAYMSPEQLGDPHHVDARTDVYAFGVILYEVLTGWLPFEGANAGAMAVKIATSQPTRPSTIVPNLRRELEEVVLRALARDRTQRYPDMLSLVEALMTLAADGGEVRVLHTPTVAREATVLAPAADSGEVSAALRSRANTESAEQRPPSRSRLSRAWYLLPALVLLALIALWAVMRDNHTPKPVVAVHAPEERPRSSAPAPVAPERAAAAETPAAALEEAVPALPPGMQAPRAVAPVPRSQTKRSASTGRKPRAKPQTPATENELFSGRK